MRKPRLISNINTYHVVTRGTGRQLIYEDDEDRFRFLELLSERLLSLQVDLLAWCLMGNHIHLLLKGDLKAISMLMASTCSMYAQYFNLRHDRIGSLFQGRFKSEPILDEQYLLSVVRYIHLNPEKAGIDNHVDYIWSSYSDYINARDENQPLIPCHTETIIQQFSSLDDFKAFHCDVSSAISDLKPIDLDCKSKLDYDTLLKLSIDLLGEDTLHNIKTMPKEKRNEALEILRDNGFSIRQIERVTGVGRKIISLI